MSPYKFSPKSHDYTGAHCSGLDPWYFTEYPQVAVARRVCEGCPVSSDCFFEGVGDRLIGVWGGTWIGRRDQGNSGPMVGIREHERTVERHLRVLSDRLGLSRMAFVAEYGAGVDGVRRALDANRQVQRITRKDRGFVGTPT